MSDDVIDPTTGEVVAMEGKQAFVRCPTTGDLFLTPEGREVLSSVPIAPPVGFVKQPSLVETIRAMVRQEKLAQELASQGYETFEEADDFEVDDDFDPGHPYEAEFDPDPTDRTEVSEPPSPDAASGTPPSSPSPKPPHSEGEGGEGGSG